MEITELVLQALGFIVAAITMVYTIKLFKIGTNAYQNWKEIEKTNAKYQLRDFIVNFLNHLARYNYEAPSPSHESELNNANIQKELVQSDEKVREEEKNKIDIEITELKRKLDMYIERFVSRTDKSNKSDEKLIASIRNFKDILYGYADAVNALTAPKFAWSTDSRNDELKKLFDNALNKVREKLQNVEKLQNEILDQLR